MPVHYAPATGTLSSFWLLIAIPLASAALLLVLGRRADRWGHWLGVASVFVSFVLGLVYFVALRGVAGPYRSATLNLYDYLTVGRFQIKVELLFDPLSAIFVLLITGVGFLIHLYAVGYMADDPGRRRFFGYFNLFVAAMLTLVLGANYLITFIGWEGVGLASYLLIAFWFARPSATTAGKKAFIMNRVGKAGSTTVLLLGLLLLIGACGKSGQFPLQAWLPDAMEGPTPVSALIHAATMVTAGVYLVARSRDIFNATEDGRLIVTLVGAVTLLIGCIIGCAYDDIKKVLAYSTVSQIGYMFLAVGLGTGVYAIGVLHLLTHGFFKAGLFLGAGSVMHAMNDEVNMRRFGGLWRYLKITWITFGLAWLAIIGLPPLSGYFSKDPIIEAAFNRPGWTGWLFGGAALLGAGLTAFYMTRLFVLTFHGPKRWTDAETPGGSAAVHPHESPPVMTVPLILLGIGSLAAGALMATPVKEWLAPVFGNPAEEHAEHLGRWPVTILTLLVVLIGAGLAVAMFRTGTALAEQPAGPVVTAARRNLYGDAVNEALVEKPGLYLTRALVFLDNKGVDGLVNGLAATVGGSSGRLRRAQTGFVRTYALSMLGGALLVVAAMLAVALG